MLTTSSLNLEPVVLTSRVWFQELSWEEEPDKAEVGTSRLSSFPVTDLNAAAEPTLSAASGILQTFRVKVRLFFFLFYSSALCVNIVVMWCGTCWINDATSQGDCSRKVNKVNK